MKKIKIMRIKNYIDFINESKHHEFGCVMLEVPVSNWNEITSSIDTSDIYTKKDDSTYGIQKDPHITLLYGYDNSITPEMVKDVIGDVRLNIEGDYDDVSDRIEIERISSEPIEVEIDGIDIFENKDFDVVKFNVKKSFILQELHDELSTMPNSNKFKEYTPHITIAYVKKGTGKKYIREYKHKVKVDTVIYSMPSGKEVKFKL